MIKKITQFVLKVCLGSIFLFILSFSILQTKWAKDQIQQSIISYASQRGIQLSMESIEGRLPFSWIIKDMHADLPYLGHVQAAQAKIRLSLFSIWKGVLELSFFEIENGMWQDLPFSVQAKGKISLFLSKGIEISSFSLQNDLVNLRAAATLLPDLSIEQLTMDFSCNDLAHYDTFLSTSLKGEFHGKVQIKEHRVAASCHSKEIQWEDRPFSNAKLNIEADLNPSIWKGNINFSANHLEIPLEGKSIVHFDPVSYLLTMNDLSFTAPQSQLCGSLMLTPSLQFVRGTLYAQFKDLTVLRPFFKNSHLAGQVGAKLNFDQKPEGESLLLQAQLENFRFRDFSLKQLHAEANLLDLFTENPQGTFSIEGENLEFPQMSLSSIDIDATLKKQEASPFSFSIKGTWKDPLELEGKGVWRQENKNFFIQLKQFYGLALNNSFNLKESCAIQWSPDHFKLSSFFLNLPEGNLQALVDLNGSSSFVKVKGDHFPLDYLEIFQRDLTFRGSASFDLDLIAWKENLQGTFNLSLEQMALHSSAHEAPLQTKGSLQVHLNQNTAQVHGHLKSLEKQFLDLSATLPIRSSHFPLKIEIDPHRPVSSELTMEGKLQNLFSFINIGAHRLEGWLSAHLFLSKNFSAPIIQGNLELHQGIYENYHTGTSLKKIEATIIAHEQKLELTAFDATDMESEGSIHASGHFALNPKEKFPYQFDADLVELTTISFDSFKGKFTGKLFIHGNQESAKAEGDLVVAHARFKILDRLPAVIPELPITFINAPEHVLNNKLTSFTIFPFYLDVNLHAKDHVFVVGRGLDSEWHGDLNVTGTHVDVRARGKLSLIKGEYLFAGKAFSLNEGEIIFNDKATPSAYISLKGSCSLADADVTAMLHGPLSAPILSFQSQPQMATSSLLSHLLFDKDTAEISALQAIQLAQAIISLSQSEAPDILEKIRKTLGIDRLYLVPSEGDPDNQRLKNQISVQIGKYLMRGVLLTLSQGAESRNISIEVQLRRGFTFQAELGENDRGKFSFKWHHNY